MFKLLFSSSVDICDLYLFHITSVLNPDFKLVNNLISSSLGKVTTGIYNLQLFIARVLHLLENHLLLLEDHHQLLFLLN